MARQVKVTYSINRILKERLSNKQTKTTNTIVSKLFCKFLVFIFILLFKEQQKWVYLRKCPLIPYNLLCKLILQWNCNTISDLTIISVVTRKIVTTIVWSKKGNLIFQWKSNLFKAHLQNQQRRIQFSLYIGSF